METYREFVEEEEHNNWFKVVVAFLRLLKPLRPFIDQQIRNFHEELRERCGADECVHECSLKNWKPRLNQVPPLCEVCSRWRDAIKENSTGGKIMWLNSEPHLWAKDEWEVAKVYMTENQKNKKSVDKFDIAALLSLMARCKFFKRFSLGNSCEQVAMVRNNVMHSANYQLKKEDLHSYLQIIRGLGEALSKRDPQFRCLSEDISVIQNTEYREILQEIKKAQEAREEEAREAEAREEEAREAEAREAEAREEEAREARAREAEAREADQMRMVLVMLHQIGDKLNEDDLQRRLKGKFGKYPTSRKLMFAGWNYLVNLLLHT